jgi:hypothetical protein
LRVADQTCGIYPEVCVLSGVKTSRAVWVDAPQWEGRRWLLAVPGFAAVIGRLPGRRRCSVALPVGPAPWKRWRRRHVAGVAMLGFGLITMTAGIANRTVQQIWFGVVTAAMGTAYLTYITGRFWVVCRYRPATGTIVVERTHPLFDAEARVLFLRSV